MLPNHTTIKLINTLHNICFSYCQTLNEISQQLMAEAYKCMMYVDIASSNLFLLLCIFCTIFSKSIILKENLLYKKSGGNYVNIHIVILCT